MKQINYCRCFIMSELKYIASKNGLKYKIVRFEAGSEGKRAKINQKAATVDFTVYPAKFEPNLKLTNEEIEEISVFTKTMETELEAANLLNIPIFFNSGKRKGAVSGASGFGTGDPSATDFYIIIGRTAARIDAHIGSKGFQSYGGLPRNHRRPS